MLHTTAAADDGVDCGSGSSLSTSDRFADRIAPGNEQVHAKRADMLR